jgi:hypothetical protein
MSPVENEQTVLQSCYSAPPTCPGDWVLSHMLLNAPKLSTNWWVVKHSQKQLIASRWCRRQTVLARSRVPHFEQETSKRACIAAHPLWQGNSICGTCHLGSFLLPWNSSMNLESLEARMGVSFHLGKVIIIHKRDISYWREMQLGKCHRNNWHLCQAMKTNLPGGKGGNCSKQESPHTLGKDIEKDTDKAHPGNDD